MSSDWQENLQGRELTPEELALNKEELGQAPPQCLSSQDSKIIEKTWREMRQLKPELFAVFKPWVQMFQLRDDSTQYSHGVYRGFYAEMARRLMLTEPAVKHRLKRAQLWFAERLQKNNLGISLQ